MSETAKEQAAEGGLKLGTFLGVYTPTILTILGVILYLRFGWVVGHAGVLGSMLIVLFANSITAITALSLSALATNMRVGVGGAYYILSRSMGLELGGALGIPLYLSQVLSVTLYAFGLAESSIFLAENALGIGGLEWAIQPIAAIIVIGVTLLAARSTELALRAQVPIMVLIAVSLLAAAAGVWGEPRQALNFGPFEEYSFFQVFAVFFPAVTGVLAGVTLSGDLANPARSIPRGVLLAVATGFGIYISMPLLLGSAGDVETLQSDTLILGKVAVGGLWLVAPGLFGAILSSAIGSILGAPRTLLALSMDGLVPKALGRTDPKNGEPMIALGLSGLLALMAVALGDLNAVAQVVTMFFLTTYGMLNLAAALEAWIKDPSYRPRLRVPFQVSLLGALGCFLAMALINAVAFVVAVVVELGIWWWLNQRRLKATWGDLRTGLWLAMARFAMMKLRIARLDPRNWRPHILVFTPDLRRDVPVVDMAAHFGQDRGIVSVVTLVEGSLDDRGEADALLARHRALLEEAGVLAFPEVHTVSSLEDGVLTVSQANGFAGIESNMVCFAWPRSRDQVPRLLAWVRQLDRLQKSAMVMRPTSGGGGGKGRGEILVWWKGKESNGDLMLLLAHLLELAPAWRGHPITLVSIVEREEDAEPFRRRVGTLLADSNIDTAVEALVRPPERSVNEVMFERSRTASLVFLGLPIVPPGQEEAAAASLVALVEGLPSAILVRNSSPFRGRLV